MMGCKKCGGNECPYVCQNTMIIKLDPHSRWEEVYRVDGGWKFRSVELAAKLPPIYTCKVCSKGYHCVCVHNTKGIECSCAKTPHYVCQTCPCECDLMNNSFCDWHELCFKRMEIENDS
jgi:hypothetical protein